MKLFATTPGGVPVYKFDELDVADSIGQIEIADGTGAFVLLPLAYANGVVVIPTGGSPSVSLFIDKQADILDGTTDETGGFDSGALTTPARVDLAAFPYTAAFIAASGADVLAKIRVRVLDR